jgi:hypothetical protein
MKITNVTANNRRRAFEVATRTKHYLFPYARLEIRPSRDNPICRVYVDRELDGEGFTYELASGAEGTVHLDHVLEYNRDPRYMRDLMLYRLTLLAQDRIKESGLSKREVIRRLQTSPAQLYRLLDQTNYRKSIDQLMRLLHVLDCEVEFAVKSK